VARDKRPQGYQKAKKVLVFAEKVRANPLDEERIAKSTTTRDHSTWGKTELQNSDIRPGRGNALLRSLPLRTVLATFTAHGSSKLLTNSGISAASAALSPLRRLLLVAIQME
jgi:hypothetical protein